MSTVTAPPETDLERAALAWCWEHGYDGMILPKGQRGSTTNCPLARATGLSVGESLAWVKVEGKVRELHYLPREVVQFRAEFDKGEFPQFDMEAGE